LPPLQPSETSTAMSSGSAAPAGSTYAFNADIAQLMSLIINTFYSVRHASRTTTRDSSNDQQRKSLEHNNDRAEEGRDAS